MKSFTYALIGAVSLITLPALAQSGSSPSTTGSSNSAGSSSAPMSQSQLSQLQQKITSDLQSDGYKNVRVVPNSFLVHATNKQGNPVVMIINPDSVFAVTEAGPNTANNNSPTGAQSHANGALGSSGNTAHSNTSNAR